MDLELQRDNIQHEIKEIRNCLARQKEEAKQVVEVEKKNELKVLELSIEKDQLHSEVESLRSQLEQAEGNYTRDRQNQLEKIKALQDQLHEDQRGSKESVEKLKQVCNVMDAGRQLLKTYITCGFVVECSTSVKRDRRTYSELSLRRTQH